MLQEAPPRQVLGGGPGEVELARAPRPYLFISDLHLSPAIPRTVAAFEHFVNITANQADSVFILGDLFEYWIGDATLDDDPFAAGVAALLHTLTERGIRLYIMRGNRDFLLGPRFMAEAGAKSLTDPSVIVAFGKRVALAHGDAQCTADRGYQMFRSFARNRAAQALFLHSPMAWRRALARHLRAKSEAARLRPLSDSPKYDVTRRGIADLFARSNAKIVIHGHTHRPAHHVEPEGIRWVLPDWDLDHGKPRGGYLQIDAEGIHALPLAGY